MSNAFPIALYRKIGAIIKENVTVEKNGYNAFHKYKYSTESDITEVARKMFIKYNLAMSSTVENVSPGPAADITRVHVKFTLVDLDTGEYEVRSYYGDGQDKGDKGLYKAYTGAVKYFLAKTLMISTDDDPEKDEDETPKRGAKNERPKYTPSASAAGPVGASAGTGPSGNNGDGWD